MKLTIPSLAAATLFAAAVHIPAQAVGTSHPEELNDTISTAAPKAEHYSKPSPAITTAQEETPLPAPKPDAPAVQEAKPEPVLHARDAAAPPVHDYNIPVPGQLSVSHHAEEVPVVGEDINSGIVSVVRSRPNELPEGTLLRARLDQTISTGDLEQTHTFTARLTADVDRQGKVLIPAGSIIAGRITEIRKGKRGASAMIRLQPDNITLPDGARFDFNAQLVDLDHFQDSHVSTEGAVLSNDHTKAKLAALTLTTGSAVAAGAVLGGPPGAIIGAGVGITAGAIWWLKQDHQQQTLPEGTGLILSLNQPLLLVPESPTLAANGN